MSNLKESPKKLKSEASSQNQNDQELLNNDKKILFEEEGDSSFLKEDYIPPKKEGILCLCYKCENI